MDRSEQIQNSRFRHLLVVNIENQLREISGLEDELGTLSQNRPLTDLTTHYLRLGNAYTNLLDLLTTSSANTSHNPNLALPAPNSTTTAYIQDTPMPNALEAANSCFKSALDIANINGHDGNEYDKRRIEIAVSEVVKMSLIAQKELKKQLFTSEDIVLNSKPKYRGYWTRKEAFLVPFVILLIVLLLNFISFSWHIPISVALHIPPYNCVPGSIVVNGSTTVLPLVNIASTEYHKLCPDSTVKVNPSKLSNGTPLADDSADSLDQVLHHSINIATSDASPADPSQSTLNDYPIAITTFALMINSDVTHTQKPDLSSYQIAAIYNGDPNTRQWSAMGKDWKAENITLVSRPTTSQTRMLFEQYVLKATEGAYGPYRLTSDTNDDVANSICKTSGAIGYLPLFYYYDYNARHNHCLNLVTINHADPESMDQVKNNIYPFWSVEHMYTNGPAQGLTQAFINFMYSDLMKSYINEYGRYGYLSPIDIQPDLLANH